ncbi:MAG TPA: hypothetical protein DCS77_06650 [Aeromonas salmonicida]|nr:hypothetical protein [Aeromonas salmonicida]
MWNQLGQPPGGGVTVRKSVRQAPQGEVMVRDRGGADNQSSLVGTAKEGGHCQKYKKGNPPLEWQWLENAILPLSASSKPLAMIKRLALR